MIREPAVRGATAPAHAAKASTTGRDFAGELRHAEVKPARKPLQAKTAAATDPDGGSLPPRGSASPPPAAPVPPPIDADESQAATSAATPGGTPGAAQPAQRELSAGTAAAVVPPGSGRTVPEAPAVRDVVSAYGGAPATDFGVTLGDPAALTDAGTESRTAATPAAAALAAQGMKSLRTPAGATAAQVLSGTEAATNDATLRAAPGAMPGDSTTSTTAVTDAGFAVPPPPAVDVQATSAASVQTAGAATAQVLSGSGAAAIDADGGDKRARTGIRGKALDGIAGAGMAALGFAAASPAMTTPAGPPLKLSAAVGSPEFSQGLAERVTYLVDNNLNGAKLQVNPPQLGPIEVRIAVQGDHAQVWMSTHSLVTRDALESSSPKLREMLNAQGFGQVSVDISQRSFHDRSAHTAPSSADRAEPAAAATIASTTAPVSHTVRSSAALDAYA